MSDSESPLSSAPDTEDEIIPPSLAKGRSPSVANSPTPPPVGKKPRRKETPHVPTFADIPEIAFIIAFQSRFNAAFKGVPNLGPQDLEAGVINKSPSEQVEQLLCRLLSLILNRKKNVERGHHNRALEDAIQANQSQWSPEWEGRNPLAGGKKFDDLDAKQRLVLLRYLILWALSSSEVIRATLNENYKTSRRNDDLNVALSIQPWGRDADKRRYWLIEGKDDTYFRLYRESNPALKNITWISIAGTIDELKAVATDLQEHGNKHSTEMAKKIYAAIPRFEEGENKRKRREYRTQRKNYFTHQAAAFSYEGRTRGKRIRYTYSDDDEGGSAGGTSDGASLRRSERTSRAASNAPEGPRFTASGRQIKRPTEGRYGGVGGYGTSTGAATPASVGSENGDTSLRPSKRSRRNGVRYDGFLGRSADSEDSYDSQAEEDEYEDNGEETDEDEMSVDDTVPEDDHIRGPLIVPLKYITGGKVARYLMKRELPESPVPSPVDAIMAESIADGDGTMTDKQTGLGPAEDPHKKALPVLEARPMNGTAMAEIRSKGADAG